MNYLFVTTAQGLEELLKKELETLGVTSCKITFGGIYFQADNLLLYRILLWSRLASRVFLLLRTFNIININDLYYGTQMVDWLSLFSANKSFAVRFSGTNKIIRNSQYGAMKIKDAIVDVFNQRIIRRPSVNKYKPDIIIQAFLHHHKLTLLLDLSGGSLYHRNYRNAIGKAPIKENLAAAIIIRSGWKPGTPFIDPLCGSGTLLIEAVMIAAKCAPGLLKLHWGFNSWLGHDEMLWQEILHEARFLTNISLSQTPAQFYGIDIDNSILKKAFNNAKLAGVSEKIIFHTGDATKLINPFPQGPCGTIVSNLPYGKRLKSEPALIALHHQLGRVMKNQFPGWQLSLFSSTPTLLNALMLQSKRSFKIKNGPLSCEQKNYLLTKTTNININNIAATDFANRLRKNSRILKKWAKREKVDCYRLYDADLPEYNVAIDRYNDWVVIQEYVAPKIINSKCARIRLHNVINETLSVLDIPIDHLIVKVREKQKGKNQYEKLSQKNNFFLVKEYGAKLWVNLTDYLDTGLFLDHRITRKMLREMSYGKDFLNLFSYTGTASVHVGLGGARSTTSVDLSRTYLDWAKRNMHINGLLGHKHRLIQADCL